MGPPGGPEPTYERHYRWEVNLYVGGRGGVVVIEKGGIPHKR